MNYEQESSNTAFISGLILSEPKFSHETFGEGFYDITLGVQRLSQQSDELPVTISEKLLSKDLKVGDMLSIKGQLRSYNKVVDGKSKLMLTVFAREVISNNELENPNIIEINGYICKQPIYRTTPFKREICDILMAVNRAYNKSDYLPCIAWGRNARYLKDLQLGTKLAIVGRIQSRIYQKKTEQGELVDKVAYEISISKVNAPENEEIVNGSLNVAE